MKLEDYFKENQDDFQDEKISSKADTNFEKLLSKEFHQQKKQRVIFMQVLPYAASIALLVSVFFWLNKEPKVSEEKLQLMANLEAESVGKRLEGVYAFNDDFVKEDKKIINTLLNILHTDENANVKIATIDALLKFPKNENIRKNLIKALENEETPLVQIKLIKAVSFLRENRAQKPLEKIIENEQTFPIVKNNATLAMAELKN